MKLKILGLGMCLIFTTCNSTNENTDDLILPVIESLNHITAGYKFKEVESYSRLQDTTLRLKSVFSDNVNYDGTSATWRYKYSFIYLNTHMVKNYYFSSSFYSVSFDSSVMIPITTGDAFITGEWMNSSNALLIAEKNGGTKFRNSNPVCSVSASLGEAVVTDAHPYWGIYYKSLSDKNKYIYINVDAVTGSVKTYP